MVNINMIFHHRNNFLDIHILTAFCVFKYTKHGNKKFTIAAYCVFKYTNINYHDTQKPSIFFANT